MWTFRRCRATFLQKVEDLCTKLLLPSCGYALEEQHFLKKLWICSCGIREFGEKVIEDPL
jgi:hypothetical protein